nr:hypothetical protein [Tanacetum cinerariifolium]
MGVGFLWERVVEVMGSSGGIGGVVRSREEVVAGLVGVQGKQYLFKRGGEKTRALVFILEIAPLFLGFESGDKDDSLCLPKNLQSTFILYSHMESSNL